MKAIFTAIACLFSITILQAQQHYRFSETTGAYSELSGSTVIDSPDFDNDNLTFITMGTETFNFFGVDFPFGGTKTIAIQTFGDVRIDNDSSTIIIDGIFANLDSIDSTTSISWLIEGNSGEKILKAQWKNVALANGQPGNFANFQIWIYQKSGIIELRYGPRSANNATGYTNTTGPYAGIFYSNNLFNKMHEKLWVSGEPTLLQLDSSATFIFSRLLGIPASNTILRFTPKSYQDTSTAIQEVKDPNSSIMLFPNPAHNRLHISTEDEVLGISVISIDGRKVEEMRFISPAEVDIRALPPGAYILKITTDKGVSSQTFQKN